MKRKREEEELAEAKSNYRQRKDVLGIERNPALLTSLAGGLINRSMQLHEFFSPLWDRPGAKDKGLTYRLTLSPLRSLFTLSVPLKN